eukprot:SAG22_NODE_7574_length_727_cov_1.773885_1_plen_50_part_10
MNDEQRYLFDTDGLFVVDGVLSPQQLAECNAVLDAREAAAAAAAADVASP